MTNAGLTRRQMIGAGLASFAAVAFVPALANAEDRTVTYALDPSVATETCASCAACSACGHHAANKLFSTKKAADAGRAHKGCRCSVVEGQSLSAAVFTKVFEAGEVADRRHASTKSALDAEVEQHSVPLFSGVVPVAVLVVGAAGIMVAAAHRGRGNDASLDNP